MFIKKEFEKEVKVKGKEEPELVKFIEVQRPDGDTVVLQIKEGKTKSKTANTLLERKKKSEELEAKAKAKSKTKTKAKAKAK